ncbi:MAG: IS256 family transposase, partial [Armatimonadetes bacterium]|nr:IS256 family transposase [Armatimonadota bacterium]
GSKALRAAIDVVFGSKNPVQRCRNHKVENVTGHLPQELRDQVKTVMKAAYRLPADEGIARLKQQASWLEREYPSAAASLLEGLDETFTVNRLSLSVSLRRCLATTNIVESPTSGVRLRTRRVTHWQNGEMVLRWAAAALLETENSFRKIMGYKDLWMLKAVLDEETITPQQVRVA